MTERAWSVFAFKKNDDTAQDRRDGVPEWRLGQAVNWAVFRGFDTILIELVGGPVSSSRQVTHHVCRDGMRCPGGCN